MRRAVRGLDLSALIRNRRYGNFLGFLICAALIAYALYAQYGLNLEPCPLCIFQRVAVIAVGVLFLLAALHNPGRSGASVYGVLLILAAAAGAAIATRHVWIQAQPSGSVAACGASLDYMLDILPLAQVITKVLTGSGECANVDWRFLGLSMPWWTLFAFVLLGAWNVWTNLIAPATTPSCART